MGKDKGLGREKTLSVITGDYVSEDRWEKGGRVFRNNERSIQYVHSTVHSTVFDS